MKKIFTTLVALIAITHFSCAQWTGVPGKIYPTTLGDRIGIGTIIPTSPLDVSYSFSVGMPSITIGANYDSNTRTNSTTKYGFIGGYNHTNTAYPISLIGYSSDGTNNDLYIGGASGSFNSSTGLHFFTSPAFNTVAGTERMVINGDGNVGIGTTTPQETLSVNGNIRSKQVKVETNNWPDYVFKSSYILPSLLEVKTYIDKYQHLPDMPTETEVAKDGLNLGDVMKTQTKKIEELTLYLIEKDRQVNELQSELSDLKRQMAAITKALNKN